MNRLIITDLYVLYLASSPCFCVVLIFSRFISKVSALYGGKKHKTIDQECITTVLLCICDDEVVVLVKL